MQAYSDPTRKTDAYALPDVEIFYDPEGFSFDDMDTETSGPGWYWWSCFPGCLPDSDPIGPFTTEAEALADAQDGANWENV